MRIKDLTCPRCAGRIVVDTGLADIGTVRVRCVHCDHYFLPPGASGGRTIRDVTNASVAIDIWEPTE